MTGIDRPNPTRGAGLRIGALLLVHALAFPALATEEAELGDELGSEEAAFFNEIPSVYAASKHEQKVTDAPAAVSIVTGEQIQKLGYRTLSQVLGSVAGMVTTNDRNYTYLAARGFGVAGDYNSRVLLLVDGHRVNDAVYGSAPLDTEFPVHVDLIERVEVVPGPSSSIYGSSAFLAVINVITRDGRNLQGPELSSGGGSLESWMTRGAYGNRFDNGVEVLLSSSYQRSEGDDSIYFAEFDDPSTNNGRARNADQDLSYQIFGELSYEDLKLQVVHGDRRKEIPTASFGTVFNVDDTYTRDRFTWLDLSYDTEVGNGWQLAGRAFFDRYEYDGDYAYDYPPLTVNRDRAVGERWGADLGVSRRFLDMHLVSVGAGLDHNYRQDQSNRDAEPSFFYLEDERDSLDYGIYLQDEIDVFDWLDLSAGVRYDRDGEFGDTVNPRAAVIVSPLEATTLKFLYGTAFRAPTAYELYYNDDGNSIKGNSSLDPETIETFEVVIDQGIGENLRGSVSGYFSRIDDLIELVTDPGDGLLVLQNRSEVESLGLELRLDGHWENGLEAELSYALQRTEDTTTKRRLTNSAEHLVSSRLMVPLLARSVFGGVELRYVSDRKTVAGATADDAILTNLTLLSRDLLLEGLQLQFGIDNVFDVSHSDPVSEEFLQPTIDQNGRLFFGKLTHQF